MSEAILKEDTTRQIESLRREMEYQKRELERQLQHQQWTYEMKLSELRWQLQMERSRELDRQYYARAWVFVGIIVLIGAWTVTAQLIS